jgi:hypothetical protein
MLVRLPTDPFVWVLPDGFADGWCPAAIEPSLDA